jgi:hypothetical protein
MESSAKEMDAQRSSIEGQSLDANNVAGVDKVLERKILHKFDKWVMPQMALLVLFGYLDRTNIGE